MSDETAPQSTASRPPSFWLALAAAAALVILALAALFWDEARPLKPVRPEATAVSVTLSSQPILVTFPELNERPFDFQNQRLRVSGSFTRLVPPACVPYSGPIFRWGLITDELQMNASGFESLVRLLPGGTSMTVEGIWRLYTGPLGCGKGPAADNIWYLQVERIVQPNPFPPTTAVPAQPDLPSLTATPTFIPSPTPGGIPATIAPGATATATATDETMPYPGAPTATLRPGETAVATATPTATPDNTASTPGPGTPSVTPSTTPTSSATPNSSATLSPTPRPGAGVTLTPTLGPGFITSTPAPTSTPGSGYPGDSTPFPTITPGSGYPSD